jgi:hypothetical protein
MVSYLDIADVLVIAEQLSGRGVAELEAQVAVHELEAALLRPSAELGGRPRHVRLSAKAAALMSALLGLSLPRREARALAWFATREFLARNGAPWDGGVDVGAALFALDGLETGELDVGEVGLWIESQLGGSSAAEAA